MRDNYLDNINRPRFSAGYMEKMGATDALQVEKEKLITRLTAFISTLPREVQEDLAFYSGQIIDRRGRRDEALVAEEKIIEMFPTAESVDPEVYDIVEPILQEIAILSGTEYQRPRVTELKELTETETVELANKIVKASITERVNRRKVEKIKQASEELINNVYPKPEEPELEKEPEDLGVTVFTDTENEITSIINAPELEPEKRDTVSLTDERTGFYKVDGDSVQEVTIPEEDAPKLEPLVQEPKFTHTMLPGQSLTDIALVLCEDVNGWMDIYAANRDQIENELIKKNFTDFGNLENDKEVFTGLTFEIPTIFTKDPSKLNK